MNKIIILLLIFFVFYSCKSKTKYESYEALDSVSYSEESSNIDTESFISSSAAKVNLKDSNKKFIRTANIKFRVDNVYKTSLKIEKIILKQNGFVEFTELKSEINNKIIIPLSIDSSLESIYYNVYNNLTLRIPADNLDTTLKEIAQFIKYLDYRIIKADDVSLQFLANNLSEKRNKKYSQRISSDIDGKGKKLNQTLIDAEDNILDKQEKIDNLKIESLNLLDRIQFSTIELQIYQREIVKREIIVNEKNIKGFKISFWREIYESFNKGWNILKQFILFVIRIWSILLICFIIYLVYRKFFKTKKIIKE